MRVALTDDSALFRSGLQMLLQACGVEVTSQASSGDELMANIVPDRPDAVILDLRMPPIFTSEGIDTATAIRPESHHPEPHEPCAPSVTAGRWQQEAHGCTA